MNVIPWPGRAMHGGELVVAICGELGGLDPHDRGNRPANAIFSALFDPLVTKTADGDYLPGLAEGFALSADGRVCTLRLREGVHFHDGLLLTAQAVKFSLERALAWLPDPGLRGRRDVRLLDASTLEIHFEHRWDALLDALSRTWLAPVSPAALGSCGTRLEYRPVGTGPFVLAERVVGKYLLLRRNPDYAWGPPLARNRGCAHLESIRFVQLCDASASSEALAAGAVDVVFDSPCANNAHPYRTHLPLRGVRFDVNSGVPLFHDAWIDG